MRLRILDLLKQLVVACVFILLVSTSVYAASGGHSGKEPTIADLKFYYINFLIYLAIVVYIFRKFAPSGWSARRQRIQETLQSSIVKVADAERAYQSAKQRFDNLEEDVRVISDQMTRDSEREAQDIIESAKNQSSRIIKQAHDNAEAERKVSEGLIRKEYAAKALKIAEEKLRREITPERDKAIRASFQDSVKELVH